MKKTLLATALLATTLSPISLAMSSPDAVQQLQSQDRFSNVEVTIPTLSHDYYLGEGSNATHYWHGENRDTKWIPTNKQFTVTESADNTVNPNLLAHSKKMDAGIFVIKDKFFKLYGYGLTSATIVEGDDSLIVLDPMESADKMREAIADFRDVTGITKPVSAVLYSHWHVDHYGGVRGIDKFTDDVKIIAHDSFMKTLAAGSAGGLGPAIGTRVDYSLGTLLEVEEAGRVNGGLGTDFYIKELTLIRPNTLVEGHWGELEINIAGVDMVIKHIPSEASDEIVVHFKEQDVLWAAEVIQGESFPNLHTIRGTRYRDPQNWFPGIDVLRELDADIMMTSHGRPVIGAEHVADTLTAYRDAIQFTYDQSIKAINNGATQEDLIRDIKLPEHLKNHPWLGDYYGSIRHSAKQIFVGELGWFDGDPTTLNPLHSTDSSVRYVDLMGGKDNVMKFATDACNSGEFQWCAELATHAIRVDFDDMEPRNLKAFALRELGYRESNINWRNWYITSAQELDGTLDRSKKIDLGSPDLLAAFSPEILVNGLRFSVNAERTINDHYTISFDFGEETHALEVRNGLAQFHANYEGEATTVNLSKNVFVGVLMGKVDFVDAVAKGLITIEGEPSLVPKFFGSLDKPAQGYNTTLR
ncbi:MBL fold metallo-hydrolase [Vibrio lamellibrachiae]|uniref:alkyl/aryl-sulfatase n=1 Tax=Vibrio lamellibrachiae TaxID=2910253 RepID=UPI003D14A2FF